MLGLHLALVIVHGSLQLLQPRQIELVALDTKFSVVMTFG